MGTHFRFPTVSPRGGYSPLVSSTFFQHNRLTLVRVGGVELGGTRGFFPFYDRDGGLVASTNLVWLQWPFDIIIGLFERAGMQINM